MLMVYRSAKNKTEQNPPEPIALYVQEAGRYEFPYQIVTPEARPRFLGMIHRNEKATGSTSRRSRAAPNTINGTSDVIRPHSVRGLGYPHPLSACGCMPLEGKEGYLHRTTTERLSGRHLADRTGTAVGDRETLCIRCHRFRGNSDRDLPG